VAPKPVKILAVDDVPDNLFILESILSDVDHYKLDCVSNGKAALNYVSQQMPDLILLDVMMPGMDGYEVTRRIRENKDLPYIPVLLVTAHDQSSLSEGLDSGADDFIRKPFDIDELMARVRSLLRLKHSLDEQAEMLKQRDDFVARLTHDLRTPLVAANRMLRLTLDGVFGKPPEEMEEAITGVISNNDNLLNMTNTLLQVYRHEAGQKKIVRSPLSAYNLSKDIVQELRPLAEEKGLSLEITSAEPVSENEDPYRTEGDIIELRRLITNLVGNAIKFTDTGSIVVRLSLRENNADEHESDGESGSPSNPQSDSQSDSQSHSQSHSRSSSQSKSTAGNVTKSKKTIDIAVEDSGMGIAPDVKEQIFAWFYQGDHMRAGSGLGLHLSKRIAEMHQGTLAVKSEVGKGSTFTLSLPRS